MGVKKQDLIRMVTAAGLNKGQAQAVVDTLFKTITDELARGERVQIAGFGTFRVSEHGARTVRNPRTGGTVEVAAHKVPVFKPGATLKQAVA